MQSTTTATTTTTPAPVANPALTGLYAEVQLFYARQMQHLDAVRAEPFAATFAADGVFDHSPDAPAVRGREAIAAEVDSYNERRFAQDPVQRRHWFNMLDVREQPDGSVHTEFYAVVLTTRPGQFQPVVAPACVVRDVLVREGGELRTLERRVTQDHASF
ncbi:nuclear transport factor 2 family protein [Kitasatospora sp. NPDC057965]|uniref:nuclear transport factor 2 family protein n=1 Tax=Kitasatospora sp. NPDC057965 TaxID=3346291 RepID=UPI0036DA3DCD